MAFFQKLQQELIKLYREFPEETEEIDIRMTPNKFTITSDNNTIEVSTESLQRINYTPYVLDLFNAETDFDFGLYAETDLRVLLQYIDNTDNLNGKRLLAYSLLETKMEQMIQRMNKHNVLKIVKKHTLQNVSRLRQIAKRANQLMEITSEFPIRLTTRVTPRWLYRLTNGEFEEFLRKCRRMSDLERNFAGAQ